MNCADGNVAGVDEAGRGPLAGPVVAAAVILGTETQISGLADSKKLSVARRKVLDLEVRCRSAAWAIAMATVEEIDSLNIHNATLLAMRRAVIALPVQPDQVLVDGKYVPCLPMLARAEIGGDARIEEISAASILAKQARDDVMERLHLCYPEYGFLFHKGYPTRKHLEAIEKYGVRFFHRRSYAPVRRALQASGVAG